MLYLGDLLFSEGKWRWGEPDSRDGGNLEGVEEETVVMMYSMRKECICK